MFNRYSPHIKTSSDIVYCFDCNCAVNTKKYNGIKWTYCTCPICGQVFERIKKEK